MTSDSQHPGRDNPVEVIDFNNPLHRTGEIELAEVGHAEQHVV